MFLPALSAVSSCHFYYKYGYVMLLNVGTGRGLFVFYFLESLDVSRWQHLHAVHEMKSLLRIRIHISEHTQGTCLFDCVPPTIICVYLESMCFRKKSNLRRETSKCQGGTVTGKDCITRVLALFTYLQSYPPPSKGKVIIYLCAFNNILLLGIWIHMPLQCLRVGGKKW